MLQQLHCNNEARGMGRKTNMLGMMAWEYVRMSGLLVILGSSL